MLRILSYLIHLESFIQNACSPSDESLSYVRPEEQVLASTKLSDLDKLAMSDDSHAAAVLLCHFDLMDDPNDSGSKAGSYHVNKLSYNFLCENIHNYGLLSYFFL